MDKKALAKRLQEIVSETETLEALMKSDAANRTPENEAKFKTLLAEGEQIITNAKNGERLTGIKSFLTDPVPNPVGGDGGDMLPFTGRSKTLGEQFTDSDNYKNSVRDGKIQDGMRSSIEAKGFIHPSGAKATFDTAGTGLSTNINYVGNGGAPVMIEQQRLTVADLFSSGETTLNAIPYIRETSYTNAANTVAEGGLKPEASFATEAVSAPVKKIAVTAKVTDEMFADFPMMRDYVNNRLTFMVAQKEEQQLIGGTGTGSQIQGVMNVTGIQTLARSTDTVPDAIHKAITKIRTVGFFEPDAIVIHPNDWQKLRLLKDANNQYYGGGPFTGAYGNAGMAGDTLWGLRVVVTTAMTEGTCLVGAFKLGGQIFYRQGVTVESTNTNENDFVYNRVTIRVEERLALCIYRALAFCTVTGMNA